jgi:hypothetical protein
MSILGGAALQRCGSGICSPRALDSLLSCKQKKSKPS